MVRGDAPGWPPRWRAVGRRGGRLDAEEALDLLGVAARDLSPAPEPPLAGRRLLLEDVVEEGLAPADLARAGDLEALGGALVGLHLGHRVQVSCVVVSTAGAAAPLPPVGVAPLPAATGVAAGCCWIGSVVLCCGVSSLAAWSLSAAASASSRSCSLLAFAAACCALRSGASTMIMLRPSTLGAASTLARSETWSATRLRIFSP